MAVGSGYPYKTFHTVRRMYWLLVSGKWKFGCWSLLLILMYLPLSSHNLGSANQPFFFIEFFLLGFADFRRTPPTHVCQHLWTSWRVSMFEKVLLLLTKNLKINCALSCKRLACVTFVQALTSTYGHSRTTAFLAFDNLEFCRVLPYVCCFCGTKVTSQWRRGPFGANTLCNKHGIAYSRTKNTCPWPNDCPTHRCKQRSTFANLN